jgi:hypothetical protein
VYFVENNPTNYTDPTGHCTRASYSNKIITTDECEEQPTGTGIAPPITSGHPDSEDESYQPAKPTTSTQTVIQKSQSSSTAPTIPLDPTKEDTNIYLKTPSPQTEQMLSSDERLLNILIGLFFVGVGAAITDLGILIVATAGVELVGGVATGPLAPLVAGHALAAMAVGGITTVIGLSIMGVGGYFLYEGMTGKKP